MPKVIAKPLSLTVRPLKVSNLCFEVGGILGESFTELGAKVFAFDFQRIYKSFRNANIEAVDPERLPFDSHGIDAQTKTTPIGFHGRPFALAALRAETVKAALNKAILLRENAFITKYGADPVAAIVNNSKNILPLRGEQIIRIAGLSDEAKDILNAAYQNDPDRKGVVTTTVTTSTLTPHGSTLTQTFDPPKKLTGSSSSKFIPESTEVAFSAQEAQQTKNVDFRVPILENLARDHRVQIDMGHELINWVREAVYLDRLEDVLKNELASIDADVNQMQVAYLNTILMSPIDGIVTGVYKNPGDPVAAGEPVFRVENNDNVLFVAKVVCRGPIVIGSDSNVSDSSMLQVKTTLFDLPDSRVTIEAEVVAARGQGEDDQWEVIAKRSNLDSEGKNIFRLVTVLTTTTRKLPFLDLARYEDFESASRVRQSVSFRRRRTAGIDRGIAI
jgi:hypothetical protein